MTVGIPRTLGYYTYYPWWKAFLTGLGFEVVLSAPTSRRTLDAGVALTVNDACIPIKIFHGHVMELRDKVDLVFTPRLLSVRRLATETFCPKFRGLPDLVRASIPGCPPLIDDSVDLARGALELRRASLKLGQAFNCRSSVVARAYWRARAAQAAYRRLLARGLTPPEALACWEKRVVPQAGSTGLAGSGDLTIAALGYPYLVHDDFLSVGLVRRLRRLGVRLVTAEMLPAARLRREARRMPKILFWHYSNTVVNAATHLLKTRRIDGVIHVTAFGCGPDAMTGKLLEAATRKSGRQWFLPLTIDEHTGEGGIQTRLEAFVDMLRLRRESG